ncbi:hypothetical protein VPHD480_0194 [Vibrio phage D480]
MKFKMPNWLDNIVILAQEAKDHPKIAITALVAAIALGYATYTRAPAIASCTWKATISQSVPWDLWRHNMWTNECQYYNGKRWIALDKVMDVGAGGDELEELSQ